MEKKTFINNFNNCKSNFKLKYEYSKNEINFLDLKVKLEKGSLDRYQKDVKFVKTLIILIILLKV